MPERPVLEAVLLDAGGTLVRLDFEWIAAMLAALGCAVGADTLRRAEVEGRRRYDASVGREPGEGEKHPALGSRGDIHAYFAGMLEAAGVPEALLARAAAALEARQAEPVGLWARPMEGAARAVRALRERGLRTAVVSNSDGRAEAHLVYAGVRDGIELVIDSQIVGVEKPDAAIFRIALDALGVTGAHALFVGDIRSVDEAGARAAGVHAVILDPYGDYLPDGAPGIASIADLPEWIDVRFDTRSRGPGAEAAAHAPREREE